MSTAQAIKTNSRDEWLDVRRRGIGGTDISAILGLNPWRTPLDVYLDKTGRQTKAAIDEEAAYWGHALEDLVARRYAEVTDRKVQRVNFTLRIPDTPALANIDRAVINPEIAKRVRVLDDGHRLTTDRILECKTAHALARSRSDEWGEPGTDEVPEHYWLQVQWYLGITGATAGDLAVLFGGREHVIYTIEADRDLFNDMLEEADNWWRAHVEADVPPEPSTADEARRLWKSHTAGKEKIASVEVVEALRELASIKAEIKALEERKKEAEGIVLTAFEDAESLIHGGRVLATWKQNKPSRRTDWKAVANELAAYVPEQTKHDVIDEHTTEKPGARVLRLKTKELMQ